jgi:hypothetical protein
MSDLEVWFVSTALVISVITVACILLQTLEIIVPQIRAWWQSRKEPVWPQGQWYISSVKIPGLKEGAVQTGQVSFSFEQSAEDRIKKDLSASIDNSIANHPGTYHGKSDPKVEILDGDTLRVKYRCKPEDHDLMLASLPKMGDKHPTLDARVANSNGHRSCCVWVYYQEGNYVMLPDMRVVWQSR